MRAVNDRVLVKPVDKGTDRQTAGGIFVPNSQNEPGGRATRNGLAVSVGEGAWGPNGERQVPSIRAGDTVWYGEFVGMIVWVKGVEHVVMAESDVLLVEEG